MIEHTPHAPELDRPDGRIAGLEGGVNVDGYRVESRAEAAAVDRRLRRDPVRPPALRRAADDRARRAAAACSARSPAAASRCSPGRRSPAARCSRSRRSPRPPRRSRARRTPSAAIPQPEADDEVAELARTLQGMLQSLDDAHAETEAMLARQRRFVADASHELRTPLTSVLANLELLAESLHGDEGDAARSALRSSRRMRRLVADLLLLARSDVGRAAPRQPVDLGAGGARRRRRARPPERRARALDRRPPRDRRGRSRRALPADAQPDRERRCATPRPAPRSAPRPGSRARTPCSPCRTTAPACRPSWRPPCSSASCAAPATAAARSASASRSCAPSPSRTAARSRSRTSRRTARASSCGCRWLRARERAAPVAPASGAPRCRTRPQTSTTTGRTIGRRFRRS